MGKMHLANRLGILVQLRKLGYTGLRRRRVSQAEAARRLAGRKAAVRGSRGGRLVGALARGLSAWPVISNRNRLGLRRAGFAPFQPRQGQRNVSRSWARVMPT